MNYFAIAKNSKRAIFIINIGIFLSIFALTAASISIYIENKVSNLEFEHLEGSRFKTDMEKLSQHLDELANVGEVTESNEYVDKLVQEQQLQCDDKSYLTKDFE